jgi:hypothetical protein
MAVSSSWTLHLLAVRRLTSSTSSTTAFWDPYFLVLLVSMRVLLIPYLEDDLFMPSQVHSNCSRLCRWVSIDGAAGRLVDPCRCTQA